MKKSAQRFRFVLNANYRINIRCMRQLDEKSNKNRPRTFSFASPFRMRKVAGATQMS